MLFIDVLFSYLLGYKLWCYLCSIQATQNKPTYQSYKVDLKTEKLFITFFIFKTLIICWDWDGKGRVSKNDLILFSWVHSLLFLFASLHISIKKGVDAGKELFKVWSSISNIYLWVQDLPLILVVHCSRGQLHPVKTKFNNIFWCHIWTGWTENNKLSH